MLDVVKLAVLDSVGVTLGVGDALGICTSNKVPCIEKYTGNRWHVTCLILHGC